MSERAPRENWGKDHRSSVKVFKVGVAVAALVVAIPMVIWTTGLAQYFGVALGAVGAWRLFPDSHDFISGIVDRLPILKSKPKAEEIERHDGLEEE